MNNNIKRILKPLIWLRRVHDNYLRKNNPKRLFSIFHFRTTGHFLNTKNPKTLDDKVAYLAFNTDTSEWSRLADKVRVREYVESCGFGNYLPELFGTWDNAEEIDFSKLPNSFAIKTNNASATNIIVRDKNKIDIKDTCEQLNRWLAIDYGYLTCQPHYSKIPPKILAEELLVDDNPSNRGKSLPDYKFYCVNGTPLYVFVYTDRVPNSHIMKRTVYDMNWKQHPEFLGKRTVAGPEIVKPISFEKMKEMASYLSRPFPFVRVDFYEVNSKPIFGEMTFTPGMIEASDTFNALLGSLIHI